MAYYARIQDGRVAEFFETDADMRQMFHPSLLWVEVTTSHHVELGWMFDGSSFNPSAQAEQETVSGITLSELQRQVAELNARLAALAHQ